MIRLFYQLFYDTKDDAMYSKRLFAKLLSPSAASLFICLLISIALMAFVIIRTTYSTSTIRRDYREFKQNLTIDSVNDDYSNQYAFEQTTTNSAKARLSLAIFWGFVGL